MKQSESVLIAGAGPVGLVAANCLADAGVPVTVFEAEPQLPRNLRASTFQPPTLDMLARLGASRPLIEMGLVAPKMQYRDLNGWAVEFDFGALAGATEHPYRVQCEQFKLNGILAARLERSAHARIEYSSRVVGVEQDGERVQVEVDDGGRTRFASGAWLIGADGGRSQVREALGIPLEGFTWPERFLVASTAFDFAGAISGLCHVNYFADPQEWFFLLRVPEVWRVMFPVSTQEREDDALADDAIERRLQRVLRKSSRYDIAHRTLYSVHQRVAQTYRKGRAFLAGDAAHLNNPLGGMGLNGGIHDAFNLAEKLARVAHREAGESELDGYERERRPVALDYVNKITIRNKHCLETRDPQEQSAWREEMTRTARDPLLAREYLMRVSMIASLRQPSQVM